MNGSNRRNRPPRKECRECGAVMYTWRKDALCDSCVNQLSMTHEPGWTRESRNNTAGVAAKLRRAGVTREPTGPGDIPF